MRKFYITTPIYYVNDRPHIGHAYTSIACDVLARFKRLDDYEVFFLTGTDEHGQKVAQKAMEQGVNPQTYTDQISDLFRELAHGMNLSFDDFIRTTEQRHKSGVQTFWKKLLESGDIYLGSYSGWYAVRDEAFYAESELQKNEQGEWYYPGSGATVQWVEEPSYFFKLSSYQDKLLRFYESNPDFVEPKGRYNEVISFVKGGLKDLSISRTSFDWGIKVPQNEKHVMYVWLDALTNYITALGYPNTDNSKWNYWPADVHVVGKDILRFHAVYWPAFLMAAGLALPKKIFAHGWWMNEGQKMSKSLGNVIDPIEMSKHFGLDQFRYFLLREVPFGQDGDFSKDALIRRINTDLANDLGNLSQRVLTFIHKNAGAVIPESRHFEAEDMSIFNKAYGLLDNVRRHMDKLAFDKALGEIWSVIEEANRYIDKQAPWTLRKTNPDRMQTVLYVVIEVLRIVGILLHPFMPESMTRLLSLLAIPDDQRAFKHLSLQSSLEGGTALPEPKALFPRIQTDDKAT